ncbi:MAG: protein kinase [Candidatus Sericytochromatia bacterium]|nr:protein kinase [Candidatus Sericytochromatia bacterium]
MIVLNKYEIIEEVGRGGMGLVYRAKDMRLSRDVALKELILAHHIVGAEKDEIIARFKQEAQTAASLSHPNIITIFDVGEENNRHFIAMEFLPGKTLKDFLDEGYKYTYDEIIDILLQLSSGLEHAHSRGIIHRDIKPDNIKLLDGNNVKITDFGIARVENNTNSLTQDGTMLGTLGYISPEQLHNSKGVDTRADIFSFGAMAYEVFTKKLPFDGGTVGATILKIMTENPVPPSKIDPSIPEALENFILKCLKKDPAERYQKFKEIIQDLSLIKLMLANPGFDVNKNTTNSGFAKIESNNTVSGPPPVRNSNISNPISSPFEKMDNANKPILEKPPLGKTNLNDEQKNIFQNMLRVTSNTPSRFSNLDQNIRTTSNVPPHLNNQEQNNTPVNQMQNNTPKPELNQVNTSPNNQKPLLFNVDAHKDITISFIRIIGKIGTNKGQFNAPKGISLTKNGLILVADTQNRRVQVFDQLGEWKFMIHLSEMQSPCDVAVDANNKIYVIDSVDCYIRVFDSMGNLLSKFGGKGTNHGQFKSLGCMAICNDKIYVTDMEAYKVYVISLGGQLQTSFGKYGLKPGEYKSPYSIAIDENRIYILDYGIPRVQIIDKDGISRLIFGERGTMKGQFSIPKGIGVDKFGRIYVCDTLNHRIQVFDKNGKWIYTFGSKGNGNGQFMGPEAIHISYEGNIFILDKGNSRVQVFTYEV